MRESRIFARQSEPLQIKMICHQCEYLLLESHNLRNPRLWIPCSYQPLFRAAISSCWVVEKGNEGGSQNRTKGTISRVLTRASGKIKHSPISFWFRFREIILFALLHLGCGTTFPLPPKRNPRPIIGHGSHVEVPAPLFIMKVCQSQSIILWESDWKGDPVL